MADFDPYHKWLGIAPKDQPPHHYRLLGIDLFESDPDVIDAAANKQMAFLQSCATGPKLVFSQRLLNEIAAARLCLLNGKEKANYDAKVRDQLAVQEHRKSVSVSAADTSTEPVDESEAESNLPDFNVEEPFGIEDLIRQGPTAKSSRTNSGFSFFPKLIVAALLVCGAAGLFIRFGKSKPDLDEDTNPQNVASRDNQKIPKKTTGETRPKLGKANSSVKSIEGATDRKDAPAKSLNGSPSSSEQITNSIGMKLILIPAGEFMMGTSAQSTTLFTDETPQHLVKITKPFYLGIYEVTQREYAALLSGLNPSIVRNETLLVTNVDWDDAANFCRRLSEKEQRPYRLPTEAEWEYACWAGTNDWLQKSKISNFAWHSDNAGQRPHSVGSLKPNPFGLFDMFGNVSELCHDWYGNEYYANSPTLNPSGPFSGTSRISRGGNWDGSATQCRRAYRGAQSASHRSERIGFRVLLEFGAHRESTLTAVQSHDVSSGSLETVPSPQGNSPEVATPKSNPTPQLSTKATSETKKAETKKELKRPSFVLNDALPWAGNWYWFSENKATFQEALVQAQRAKERLVIVGSKDENRFIADRIRGPTFLGMLKEKGVWNNSLGNRQSFFNWDNGQPQNGQGEVFAAIHKDGRWHDYLSAQLYFCIEWGME